MKKNNIITNFSVLLILLMPLMGWTQSEWMVSDTKQKEKNPVAFSDASVKDGKVQFMANCKSCHGDPGKDNGLPLVPKPTDLTLQAFLDLNTDGSIYHKMTDGQITMPSYKAILSDQQRWSIVNFLRSMDKNHKVAESVAASKPQKEAPKEEVAIAEAPYYLSLSVDAAKNEATTVFQGTLNGEKTAIEGAEIFIGIKRYFNNLPVMDAGATTNSQGIIKTSYPGDLLSGEDGKAELIAYVIDTETYGEITAHQEITLSPAHPNHFKDTRALWADRSHFPWWLMITYLSIVLIVWSVMAKVVINMLKIKSLGK